MLQRAGSTNSSGSLTLLALMEPMVDAIDAAAPASATYAVEDFAAYPPKTQKRIELLAEKGIELTDEVLAKLEITPPRRNTAEGRAAMDVSEVLTSVADGHVRLAPDEAAPGDAATPRVIIDPCRSLTRIGIGGEVRCRGTSVPPALMRLGVGNSLRLQLAAAKDEAAFATDPDPATSARACAWRAALFGAPDAGALPPLRSLAEVSVRARAVALGLADAAAAISDARASEVLDEAYARVLAASPESIDAIEKSRDLEDTVLDVIDKLLNKAA